MGRIGNAIQGVKAELNAPRVVTTPVKGVSTEKKVTSRMKTVRVKATEPGYGGPRQPAPNVPVFLYGTLNNAEYRSLCRTDSNGFGSFVIPVEVVVQRVEAPATIEVVIV